MRFITEDDLRTLYQKQPFEFFELPEKARLTPGARQFLIDFRISFHENPKDQWKRRKALQRGDVTKSLVNPEAIEFQKEKESSHDELRLCALEADLLKLASSSQPMLISFGSLTACGEMAGLLADGGGKARLLEKQGVLETLPHASFYDLSKHQRKHWSPRMSNAGFYYSLYKTASCLEAFLEELRHKGSGSEDPKLSALQLIQDVLCGLAIVRGKEETSSDL